MKKKTTDEPKHEDTEEFKVSIRVADNKTLDDWLECWTIRCLGPEGIRKALSK